MLCPGSGDTPLVAYPFELLMHVHEMVFKTGWFKYEMPSYYALNMSIDYVLILITGMLALVLTFLVSRVTPKYFEVSNTIKAEGA